MRYVTVSQVFDTLRAAYSSFEEPNYSIPSTRRESDLIVTTMKHLMRLHPYDDISDANYDVSRILVSRQAALPHTVYLSHVANFAYIDGPQGQLPEVVGVLTDIGWSFVERWQLLLPAPFSTDLAGAQATLFNVLFSDEYQTSF